MITLVKPFSHIEFMKCRQKLKETALPSSHPKLNTYMSPWHQQDQFKPQALLALAAIPGS